MEAFLTTMSMEGMKTKSRTTLSIVSTIEPSLSQSFGISHSSISLSTQKTLSITTLQIASSTSLKTVVLSTTFYPSLKIPVETIYVDIPTQFSTSQPSESTNLDLSTLKISAKNTMKTNFADVTSNSTKTMFDDYISSSSTGSDFTTKYDTYQPSVRRTFNPSTRKISKKTTFTVLTTQHVASLNSEYTTVIPATVEMQHSTSDDISTYLFTALLPSVNPSFEDKTTEFFVTKMPTTLNPSTNSITSKDMSFSYLVTPNKDEVVTTYVSTNLPTNFNPSTENIETTATMTSLFSTSNPSTYNPSTKIITVLTTAAPINLPTSTTTALSKNVPKYTNLDLSTVKISSENTVKSTFEDFSSYSPSYTAKITIKISSRNTVETSSTISPSYPVKTPFEDYTAFYSTGSDSTIDSSKIEVKTTPTTVEIPFTISDDISTYLYTTLLPSVNPSSGEKETTFKTLNPSTEPITSKDITLTLTSNPSTYNFSTKILAVVTTLSPTNDKTTVHLPTSTNTTSTLVFSTNKVPLTSKYSTLMLRTTSTLIPSSIMTSLGKISSKPIFTTKSQGTRNVLSTANSYFINLSTKILKTPSSSGKVKLRKIP